MIEGHLAVLDSGESIDNRISAAREASELFRDTGRYLEAFDTLSRGMKLLPLVNHRSMATADREYLVSRLQAAASDITALALQSDKSPHEALCYHEQAKGFIMGDVMDIRTDLSALREINANLATDTEDVQVRINKLHNRKGKRSVQEKHESPRGALNTDKVASKSWYSHYGPALDGRGIQKKLEELQAANFKFIEHKEATAELDTLCRKVRELPGLSDFMLPSTEEKLMITAQHGPIVIINATALRSDALLITTTGVRSICLPFQWETIVTNISVLANIFTPDPSKFKSSNKKLKSILKWLWEGAGQLSRYYRVLAISRN